MPAAVVLCTWSPGCIGRHPDPNPNPETLFIVGIFSVVALVGSLANRANRCAIPLIWSCSYSFGSHVIAAFVAVSRYLPIAADRVLVHVAEQVPARAVAPGKWWASPPAQVGHLVRLSSRGEGAWSTWLDMRHCAYSSRNGDEAPSPQPPPPQSPTPRGKRVTEKVGVRALSQNGYGHTYIHTYIHTYTCIYVYIYTCLYVV